MTNNTINSVPRELKPVLAMILNALDRDAADGKQARAEIAAELRATLSAQSPAGVDGLEVVGVLCISRFRNNPAMENVEFQLAADVAQGQHDLCRLSDAQAIIDGLLGEVEVMTQNANNYSRMFEECAEERDQQAQRIGELEGLLRDSAELIKHGVFEDGYCCCGSSVDSHGLGDGHSPVDALAYHAGQVCERIDAALSAGKEGE